MRHRMVVQGIAFALALPGALSAQVVYGAVTTPEGRPMYGALVTLVDSAGARRAGGFTDADGRFVIRAPAPGRFSVRAELVGRATVTSAPLDLTAGDSVYQSMVGGGRTARLADVRIIEQDRCVNRPYGGEGTAAIWEEAAKALRATSFVEESHLFRFRTETYERMRSTKRNDRHSRTDTMTVNASRPFSSRTPAELARDGYVERGETEVIYHAPDHGSLLSDEFIAQHCFSTRAGTGADRGLIGLAFEPVNGRDTPDVRGVFWISQEGSELRRVDYSYTGLDAAYTMKDGGGRLEFRRLPAGAWIISRWWIRMPVVNFPESSGRRPGKPDVVAVIEAGGRVLETLPPTRSP